MKQKVMGPLEPPELERLSVDAVVDALGLICPLPIVRLGERIKEVPIGSVILLINDDPAVVLDVAAWAKSTRNELLGIARDEGEVYYCYVRKVKERTGGRSTGHG